MANNLKSKVVGENFNLENKTVLITGAGGFLGPWIAEVFGRAGARVIGVDILEKRGVTRKINKHLREKNLSSISEQITTMQADLTSERQVIKIVKTVVADYGRIDVLVHAAIFNPKVLAEVTFDRYPLTIWKKALDVNLTASFLITREVGKVMLKQNGDRCIIFFASIYGYGTPHPEIYPQGTNKAPWYGTVKAGLIYLTTHLAREWGPKGIRVNAIVPGGMANNISQPGSFVKAYESFTPLRRMAQPQDIQLPLLSLAASKYVTGEILTVDGGFTIR